MQEEEQLRNSVMLDLLYVHVSHPLAAQIMSYYQFFYQLAPDQRYWPIDTNVRLVELAWSVLIVEFLVGIDWFTTFICCHVLQRSNEWISLVMCEEWIEECGSFTGPWIGKYWPQPKFVECPFAICFFRFFPFLLIFFLISCFFVSFRWSFSLFFFRGKFYKILP